MINPIVIAGGGIAGTTCAQSLVQRGFLGEIIIISMSHLVKVTKNLRTTGRNLSEFDVDEIDVRLEPALATNIRVIVGALELIMPDEHVITYTDFKLNKSGVRLPYSKLCICTGAKPRRFPLRFTDVGFEDKILMIRDTQTVEILRTQLESARKIMIVGNGGIAIELAYTIKKCQIVWVIKDNSIGSTFFDPGASKFFLDSLKERKREQTNEKDSNSLGKFNYTVKLEQEVNELLAETQASSTKIYSTALGPDWMQHYSLISGTDYTKDIQDNLLVEYSTSLHEVIANPNNQEWPLTVKLTNGVSHGCDLIICAIGVEPNTNWLKSSPSHPQASASARFPTFPILKLSDKCGGILIDDQMRTSVCDVYAAGDVVSCDMWPHQELWFQMRLWTQAKQMGDYAATCILEHINKGDPAVYFNFYCFTHVTRFFGFKVVLLGRFNGQNLDRDHELMIKTDPNKNYIKLVMKNGRIKGAVLVGDTGLEETFENLINDQIDVGDYGAELLNGSVDIEDFFD